MQHCTNSDIFVAKLSVGNYADNSLEIILSSASQTALCEYFPEVTIIEKEFYVDYKKARLNLFAHLKENNPAKDEILLFNKSQKLLDRFIFVCFCEDMQLIPSSTFRRVLEQYQANRGGENGDLWGEVKKLFQSIDKGNPELEINKFNGGLFARDREMDALIIRDAMLAHLLKLAEYDFASELNVNILGHIFEQSISDIEEIKAEIRQQSYDVKAGKRKKDGVFYTPEHITRYMVHGAIGQWLAERKKELGFSRLPKLTESDFQSIKINAKNVLRCNANVRAHINFWEAYKKKLINIRVLDPACGSGAFLNQVFDYLQAEGQRVNDELARIKLGQRDLFDLDRHILTNNIYGVDLNPESVEITKLSLWLKTANKHSELTALDKNILCGNSLIDNEEISGLAFDWRENFPAVIRDGGFDVIVGNPPYGAKLIKQQQNYFKEKYKIGSTDTAILFIKRSMDLLKPGGYLNFIIPKAFTYASNYLRIREYLWDNLYGLVDCGKVWKEVKLEQVIISVNKSKRFKNYQSSILNGDEIDPIANIRKTDAKQFALILNGVTNVEIDIARMMGSNAFMLNEIATNRRGAPLQKSLGDSGELEVIGGAEVQRFGVRGIKGFIDKPGLSYPQAAVLSNSVLVQNIVAHIQKPVDHIQIIACIPEDMRLVILDTINQINIFENYAPEYIWCLLNSKLINWYAYCFIFGKSIRTMHFDNAITARIPVRGLAKKQQQPFVEVARDILTRHQELILLRDQFVKEMQTGLELEVVPRRLRNWYLLEWPGFLNALKKSQIRLSEAEQSEWLPKFAESRQPAAHLNDKIIALSNRIDTMVYRLYGLTYEQITEIDYDLKISEAAYRAFK